MFHSGTMIRLQNLYKQQQNQHRSRRNNENQIELHCINEPNTTSSINNNIHLSTSNTHQKEIWRKVSPDFYQTSFRYLSYIPYCFCINCCCCCPLDCISTTPPLSSTVSTAKHKGISCTTSPVSVPITCSKHLRPITIIGIYQSYLTYY